MKTLVELRAYLSDSMSVSELAEFLQEAHAISPIAPNWISNTPSFWQGMIEQIAERRGGGFRDAADWLVAQRQDDNPPSLDTENTPSKTGRGNFFRIDRRIWGALCDLERNDLAVAYLVMATGTSGANTRTKWSAEAIHKKSGMSWRDAKKAIAELKDKGFVRLDPEAPKSRPRYTLPSMEERERAVLQQAASEKIRELAKKYLAGEDVRATDVEALVRGGFLMRRNGIVEPRPESEPTPEAERVWLPNSLIEGADGFDGPAPIMQFYLLGDVWTLRLLVDLYFVHFLDSHHGVDRKHVHYRYERKQLGQQGLYTVWGFKDAGGEFSTKPDSPFIVPFQRRKKDKEAPHHPAWDSVEKLRQMGLLSFIPYLFTNDNPETKPLHSLGGTWLLAEPEEEAMREAAVMAGKGLLQPGQVIQASDDGFNLIIPAPHYFSPVVYKTIRLRFRPHTSATARWYRELRDKGPDWVRRYTSLAESAKKARPALREWEAWGTGT